MKKIILTICLLNAIPNLLCSEKLIDEINSIGNREFYSQLVMGANGFFTTAFSAAGFVGMVEQNNMNKQTLNPNQEDVPPFAIFCIFNLFAAGSFYVGLWSYRKLLTNNKKCLEIIRKNIEQETDIKKLHKALEVVKLVKKSMLQQEIFKSGMTLYLHKPYLSSLAEIKGEIKNRLAQLQEA